MKTWPITFLLYLLSHGKADDSELNRVIITESTNSYPILWRVFKDMHQRQDDTDSREEKGSRHSFWEKDKHQGSMFVHSKYHPISFLNSPKPINYSSDLVFAQKKGSLLLVKLALIALSKLFFAKMNMIDFLKGFLFKLPVFLFKSLILVKGLKLILVPLFLIAAIPLVLFTIALILPVTLPLLLPLLLFVPIVPIPVKPKVGNDEVKERRLLTWESFLINDPKRKSEKFDKNLGKKSGAHKH